MIRDTKRNTEFFNSLLEGKLSIVLERDLINKRNDILAFFQSVNASSHISLLGRENNMIPFLTVEDNLFLGLSKKVQKEVAPQLQQAITLFKLKENMLDQVPSKLTGSEQTIFQIIRALFLNQTIIIFDSDSEKHDTSVFLNNLLPILKLYSKNNHTTIVIVSNNTTLASSNYYDQCVLLEQIYK